MTISRARYSLNSCPLDAHTSMSTQALNSENVRLGMLAILLDHARLYEALRGQKAG